MPIFPASLQRALWVLWAVALAVLLLYQFPKHAPGYIEDDATYITSAEGLLRTGQYRQWSEENQPPQVHFFPGYPAFLSVVARLTTLPWIHWSWISLILAWIGILLSARLYQGWLSGWAVPAAVFLISFNPYMLWVRDTLLSEWLLLVLSLSALLIIRFQEKNPTHRWSYVPLMFLLTLAALTRPEGIVLAVAFFGVLLRKRTRGILPYVTVAVPALGVLLWFLRNLSAKGEWSGYSALWTPPGMDHLREFLLMLGQILISDNVFTPLSWHLWLGMGFVLILMGFGVYRVIQAADRSLSTTVGLLYVGGYLVIHLIWQALDARFFLPLIPWLVAYTVLGLHGLAAPKVARLAGATLLMLYTGSHAMTSLRQPIPPREKTPVQILNAIRDLPATSVVLTNKGALMYLYTKKQARYPEAAHTPEELAYLLLRGGTTHVWIRPQPLSDPNAMLLWQRTSRWLRDWPEAFPILRDERGEGILFQCRLPPVYREAFDLYQQGRYADALKRYPDFPAALNDSAVGLIDSGKLGPAEIQLKRAVALRPHFALALYNLARVDRARGRHDAAMNHLLRAQQISLLEKNRTLHARVENDIRLLTDSRPNQP